MLVLMMAEMILCGYRLFVQTILGHGGIAPLQWQHAKYKDGNETTHEDIMPDRIGRNIHRWLLGSGGRGAVIVLMSS